jgi:cytochrome c biogenesis protein
LEKEKTDIFDKIWNFFVSVKLTIVILIILALTSIIGTIIQQQAQPAKNIELLAGFFGDTAAPTIYNVLVKLDFMDMYHSGWFIGLLVLLSINLIVCSLERFPKTLRFVNTPMKPLDEKALKTLPIKKELNVRASLKRAKDEILNSLSASGYTVFSATGGPAGSSAEGGEATGENSVQLYSQKGKYSRFGVYIVHLSIILILAGAIITALFAFNGNFILPEGRSISFVPLDTLPLTQQEESERENIMYELDMAGGDVALLSQKMGMDKNALNVKMKKYGIKPLGFLIKCESYSTRYHEHSEDMNEFIRPVEFQSEIVIIDSGREVKRQIIEVNSPISYKGISFYQSSFGMLPNTAGEFILKVTPKGGQESTLRVLPGGTFDIAGTDIKGTIVDFQPALFLDRKTNNLFSLGEYKRDEMVSPAVKIGFTEAGNQKLTGWVLKRYPETWTLPDGHKIELVDYWGVEYTGLQFASDPGIGLIYFACLIMTVGLYMALFMSHKKIWIGLSGDKDSARVFLGGSANRNRLSFERDIEKILSRASQAIEERHSKKNV